MNWFTRLFSSEKSNSEATQKETPVVREEVRVIRELFARTPNSFYVDPDRDVLLHYDNATVSLRFYNIYLDVRGYSCKVSYKDIPEALNVKIAFAQKGKQEALQKALETNSPQRSFLKSPTPFHLEDLG